MTTLILAVLLLALIGTALVLHHLMIRMPGTSFAGKPPALDDAERNLAGRLEAHVSMLAGAIGARNVFEAHAYARSADWIEAQFRELGYPVSRQSFAIDDARLGLSEAPSHNIIAERRGGALAHEILVIGAHYDTVRGSPGANDNASGVAAVLELARHFAGRRPARTLRFVAFANEEPPFFRGAHMGSLVHARASRAAGEQIVGMMSLETIGYYSEAHGSQRYPPPLGAFYPARGNFVGFIANPRSRTLLREILAGFRDAGTIPSEGGALPESLPGVGWSDHWAFWQAGYPAVMITDTAPFRYPHYHLPSDTPDRLDYERIARVVLGLQPVIARLVDPGEAPAAIRARP